MAEDSDDGLGGYADCEMMPNDEPTQFHFENQEDLKPSAQKKETPQKKPGSGPVEKQKSSSRKKGTAVKPVPEEESKT